MQTSPFFFSKYGRSWSKLNKTTVNSAHARYLKKAKKENWIVRLMQFAIFIGFFAFWEISSRTEMIDPLLFSSPSRIFSLFITKMADGSLLVNTGITLFETILGFILGTLFGTVLAALFWWSPLFSKVMDPYLVILNAMPKVALGPILIVALGPNMGSIIAMGILISVIITTIVVYTAFRNVDPNYLKVIQSFGGTKKQCFFEVILPACFPTIVSSLKVNVGLSWVGVIVGEFLVSKQGLGYMIIYGFQVFNFTLVLLSLVMIAFLATIMYQLVEQIEKKLIRSR
ncbi:ABC transporter permease [Fictibacillus aquaticus]|uniref:ABC transporter permease n=1 Tax=Fictibacillus aquaticus TaxID=2021314 RepID=A0A235FAC1_9BACL|nr:ABC transporter permease [Fictibacillus aquaticus]